MNRTRQAAKMSDIPDAIMDSSRMFLSRMRGAVGIRNNHGIKLNLLYWLYSLYTKLQSDVALTPEDIALSSQLRKKGLVVLGRVDVRELALIVDNKMNDVPLVNGYAQLPRQYNPLVAPHLFRILQDKKNNIEAYYGSYFKVNWFEVQKIAPGAQPPASSFGYHTDDTPYPVIKLFVYLTDTRESNGAFRAFDYEATDVLLKKAC